MGLATERGGIPHCAALHAGYERLHFHLSNHSVRGRGTSACDIAFIHRTPTEKARRAMRYFHHAVWVISALVLAQAAVAADIDTRVIRQAARVAPQEPLSRDERVQPARPAGDLLLVRIPLNLIDTGFAGIPVLTSDALSKALSADTPVLAR